MIINPSEWPSVTVTPWSKFTGAPKQVPYGAFANSYGLRLSSEMTLVNDYGEVQYKKVAPGSCLTLYPDRNVMISSVEQLDLPDNMAGFLTLIQKIALLGITFQPRLIHSGYRGSVSANIKNLGAKAVNLYVGEGIFELQLQQTSSSQPLLERKSEEVYDRSIPAGISLDLASNLPGRDRASVLGRYDTASGNWRNGPDSD